MRGSRELIIWSIAGLFGIGVSLWLFPLVFPFSPLRWRLTRAQAGAVALERFRELGQTVEDPYVVIELEENPALERLLQLAADGGALQELRGSSLAARVLEWRVAVYERGARPGDWSYRATLAPTGELTSLQRRVAQAEGSEAIDAGEARSVADAFLRRLGTDLSRYGEPTLRRSDGVADTDLTLLYCQREALLGEAIPYGVEVFFAGHQLVGFRPWVEDAGQRRLERSLRRSAALSVARTMVPYLLVPVVALLFLRRYHAGEVGVIRASQVFLVVVGAGAFVILEGAGAASEGITWGPLSRPQVTVVWGLQIVVLWFSALAVVAALSWSVGEVRCRELWGHRLVAFDAVLRGQWKNDTVARSALRGLAAAFALAALHLVALLLLGPLGAWSGISLICGPWWRSAAWPGVSLLLFSLALGLYKELFGRLFLLPTAVARLGTWRGGAAVAVLTGIAFSPQLSAEPVWAMLVLGIAEGAVLVALFLRYDLLTTLLASIGCGAVISALPLVLSDHPFMQLQGMLPLVALALPLLVSVKELGKGSELVYRYEDIPRHVRRIAARERRRVELETARSIQASILAELPPRMAGIELAHAHLPASEMGGDFYDVLTLEDGRIAAAVGEVAGVGVSSALVMSMAKSVLATQVRLRPEAEAVFEALNRAIYEWSGPRPLTALCYVLLDPQKREMVYGCAGHVPPYRIDAQGRVAGLDGSAYPLGVRDRIEIPIRTLRLGAGDRLFLFSNGVVEARRRSSDELFGFERLEESLRRHGHRDPASLCEGVLADLEAFVGPGLREDDQTVLVLMLPPRSGEPGFRAWDRSRRG